MFAVIKTGGKQYKVSKDDVVVIEKLAADPGDSVEFKDVLMMGGEDVILGDPTVAGAAVHAKVLEQGRAAKVWNFKKRRRKHGSQRLKGHRQYITTVRVTDVLAPGAKPSAAKAAAEPEPAQAADEPAIEPEVTAAQPEAHTEAVETAPADDETKSS